MFAFDDIPEQNQAGQKNDFDPFAFSNQQPAVDNIIAAPVDDGPKFIPNPLSNIQEQQAVMMAKKMQNQNMMQNMMAQAMQQQFTTQMSLQQPQFGTYQMPMMNMQSNAGPN